MRKIFGILAALAFCSASLAQDAAYYKAIQKASSSKVQLMLKTW
jgi:hypothetical protein